MSDRARERCPSSRPGHEFPHQAPARWTATRSVAGAPPRPRKGDYVQSPCYRPGHHLHFIQAKLTARTPWNWRPGVVREYANHEVTIDYTIEDGFVVLWHNTYLAVTRGTPVRVHEQHRILEIAGAWFNRAQHSQGLGAVPDPEHPELWAAEVPVVVTDIATVRGLTGDAE
jgi:hypothetical protein